MRKRIKMHRFKAWARKAGTPFQFVINEIKKPSKEAAEKWFEDNGYEIQGSVY